MSSNKRRDFDGKNDGHGGDSEPMEKIIRPKLFKSAKDQSKRLIVILEKANLEVIKVGTGDKYELLNCDDHMSYIRKFKKDPAFCRPDIMHQVSKI